MGHMTSNRDELVLRVRRIAGQIGAVEKAIAQDASCEAILHQVAGVRGAVLGLMDELVEAHLREHVARPGLTDEQRTQGADELIASIRRYRK